MQLFRKIFTLVAVFSSTIFAVAIQDVSANASEELFISEYIEGSANNKAVEIYNPTANMIDLSVNNYKIEIYFNGNALPTVTIALLGTVAAGDVFVVADNDASAEILAVADQTDTQSFFNGNDAIVLKKDDTFVDVIGQIGFDPGTQWGAGLVSTADNTLVRKCSITEGDSNAADAFDPAVEWDGYVTDTFSFLGAHTFCPPTPTPTPTPAPTPTPTPPPTPTPTPGPLGWIQGRKYLDLNRNHRRNFWELPLNGWLIRLYDTGWRMISEHWSGHTGKPGQYRFGDLPKGIYYVCEVLRPRWIQNDPTSLNGVANLSGAGDEGTWCRQVEIDEIAQIIIEQNFGNIFNWRF